MTQEELDQLMPPMGEKYIYMKGAEGNAFYIWVSNGELHTRSIGLVNQIVNLYNAAGQKYKTIVYTVPVSTYVPQYEILHYTFNTEGRN